MVATTPRGYRYLQPSDPPDIAGSEQNLATDIDTDVSALQQARQMQRSTAGNIPDSTPSALVSWPNAGYNVGGISYSGGIYTVQYAGLYRWSLTVTWPNTTTTHSRQHLVYQNGSSNAAQEGRSAWTYFGTVSSSLTLTAGGELTMAANDTLQAVLLHNAGSTLSVTPTNFVLVRAA